MYWTEFEPGYQQRDISVTTGSIAWPHICNTFGIAYTVVIVRSELNLGQRSLSEAAQGLLAVICQVKGQAAVSSYVRTPRVAPTPDQRSAVSTRVTNRPLPAACHTRKQSKNVSQTPNTKQECFLKQLWKATQNSYNYCSDCNSVLLVESCCIKQLPYAMDEMDRRADVTFSHAPSFGNCLGLCCLHLPFVSFIFKVLPSLCSSCYDRFETFCTHLNPW
jgi:hypothetical protein